MNAKVAIVTRTKNRPLLLERALTSIFSQTMRDYSLILVNDSPDRAPVEALLARFEEEAAGRVILIHNERAEGRWGALNAGIDAAESEYFILHDDDDSWHPEFLAKTSEYLDTHPADAAVATRTDIVYERVADDRVVELRRFKFATEYSEVSLVETLKQNYVPPISLLLRRSVFAELGRFDNQLPVLADWEFNLRLLARHSVGFIDGESLAYWHHRQSSVGDDGNSVIADAGNHQRYNLLIRDAFLRRSLEKNDDLGPLLATVELLRQSRAMEEAGQLAVSQHVDVVHADLIAELTRTSAKVDRLQDQLDQIHQLLNEHASVSRFRRPKQR